MTLGQVTQEITQHLNEMGGYFKPEMKLTFIARLPGNDNADFMLTIDDLDEVIKVLERRKGVKIG
jgi:hypothetical protein